MRRNSLKGFGEIYISTVRREYSSYYPELQIRGGIEDYSGISQQKHMLCPSLELSHRDSSNDGSQNMFYGEIWLITLIYHCYPFLSGALNLLNFHTLMLEIDTSISD